MRLPNVPNDLLDPSLNRFLSDLVAAITDNERKAVLRDRPTDSVLVSTPGGKVYKIKVDDAGVISTEHIFG